MKRLVFEKSRYHRFAFYFDYDQPTVDFCKILKESFGYQQFSFDTADGVKRWVFSAAPLVGALKARFPEMIVDEEVERLASQDIAYLSEFKEREIKVEEIKHKDTTEFSVRNIKGDMYPYQKVGVEFLVASGGRAIIADAPGVGKSLQALGFIAHTEAKRSLIVCPATVKPAWEKEVKKWTKFSSVVIDPKTKIEEIPHDTQVWIINYDVLKKHMNTLMKVHFDVMVNDECFPEGTLVDTPSGPKKIEDIVPGDTVCNATGTGRVVHTSKRMAKELVKITLTDASEIVCTPNHPLLTHEGWVKASNVGRAHVIIKQHEAVQLLQQKKDKNETQSFLREELLCEVEDVTTGDKEKNIRVTNTSEAFKGNEGGAPEEPRHSSGSIKKDAKEKPHAHSCGSDENVEDTKNDWTQTPYTWWKWKWPNTGIAKAFGVPKESTVQSPNKNKGEKREWVPTMLQGGRGISGFTLGDRGGWRESRLKKNAGSKERQEALGVRVERVEVLKQKDIERLGGSEEGITVCNLQVEKHPSYSVNGFLVHNCHLVKNHQAQRTKVVRALSKNIKNTVFLSGTPLLSRPIEMFTLLNMIDPYTWNNWYDYARKYCGGTNTPYGFEAKGATNTEELHGRISRYFIRRTKDQVLSFLPPKNRIQIPVKLDKAAREEYDTAEENLVAYLKEYSGKQPAEIAKTLQAQKLAQLNALRFICASGKLKAAEDIIDSVIESGEKILVFSSFVEPLDKLQEKYGDTAVMITGRTPQDDRGPIVDAFQTDPNVQLFLGGIKSAGVGITLTAGTNVLFLDYSWNPADHQQAEDRIHRPGQEASSVNIYSLYAENTIDDKLVKMLAAKQKVFDRVIDGKFPEKSDDTAFIKEMISEFSSKAKQKKHESN